MSTPQQNEILRNLFARALDSPALDSPHPLDDEDLLLDWSLGDLSPERHEQLLDHLAACPACRREVAAMVRDGALVLPHVAASVRDAESGLAETGPRSRVSAAPKIRRRSGARRAGRLYQAKAWCIGEALGWLVYAARSCDLVGDSVTS